MTPVIDGHDLVAFDFGANRRTVAGGRHLGRQEHGDHAARGCQRKSALHKNHREIALIEAPRFAESSKARGKRLAKRSLDQPIAYPGRIAHNEIESAASCHGSEMDIEGKKRQLSTLDSTELLPQRGNAIDQLPRRPACLRLPE